jgi:hypothetical protein
MPRLLRLMFQVPMSSPQMTRMFGFFSCAKALAAVMMTSNATAMA